MTKQAMIKVLRYKADHIKAKIKPKFFAEVADALEQESVLGEIRAEIWDLQYGDEEKSMTDEDRADAYNNAIRQVIEIIDKYKAESEE